MDNSRTPRIVAAAATAVIALLLIMAMTVWRLTMPEEKPEPMAKAEIMLEEEQFVDLLEPSPLPQQADNTPASAQLPENSDAQSQPAPESGTDTKDAGVAGVAEPPVTAKAPSEVKVKKKKEEKKKAGPEVDKKKAQEESVKREANNQVSNAFASASGKHNTKNGNADKDNAGRTDGKAHQGNLSGRGTGTVGGGWRLPAYSPVPSTVTGSVKLVVKIDRDGRVTSVRFDGGNAPAATDAAVRAACVAEVKSRRFTHPHPEEAPESATAYITYTFR